MIVSKKEMKRTKAGIDPVYQPVIIVNPVIITNPINPVGDSNPLPAIPVQIPIIRR